MARDFYINGPALVRVKGNVNSTISACTDLGLSDGPIRVVPTFKHKDINVDAWGESPADVQWMLAELNMQFTMIHVDVAVLEQCAMLSMGVNQFGQMAKAGLRLGANQGRFQAGNNYIGLNITSPDGGRPWRFLFSYMPDTPFDWPLGTEKSIITTRWRVIPYTQDPYGGGQGAQNFDLWDRVLDS